VDEKTVSSDKNIETDLLDRCVQFVLLCCVACCRRGVRMAGRPRVARLHVFKPKIPIWVNFGMSCIQWKMLVK
jgi:hypothetical protein